MENLVSNSNEKRSYNFNFNNKDLLNIIIEINKKLLSGTYYQDILDYTFDALKNKIPYDRIGIALIEEKQGQQVISMNWVKSNIPISYINIPYSVPLSSSLKKIIDSNQPRIINNLTEYLIENPNSNSTKLILQDGIHSNLSFPLRFENQPIGVIFFSSCLIDTYNKEHIGIFNNIAEEISLILNYGVMQNNFKLSLQQKKNLSMTLHDLKSPLSTLQGFAEISTEEGWFKDLQPEAKNVFHIFFRNTKHMFNLLNDLNEISNLKNNFKSCNFESVNLNDFLEEAVSAAEALAQQKNIRLIYLTHQSKNFPNVYFDRLKIMRVLDNLFSNAIKYSNRGSTIEFSFNLDSNRLFFSVKDYGLGIPTNEQYKLFQEFGKTSVRPTEGESSSGQGLAIAKKIVEFHKGQISARSQPGLGSTFTFWIPNRTS